MITKLEYNKSGEFDISGTIKLNNINFETQDIDSPKFFPYAIELLVGLKGTIIKQLSDDKKILGDERIQIISDIDKLLTIILALGFVITSTPYIYSDKFNNFFEIEIHLNKMNYFSGRGKLLTVPTRDIKLDKTWYDENVTGCFKNMISLFNTEQNTDKIKEKLIKLLYNLFTLRYKTEFI